MQGELFKSLRNPTTNKRRERALRASSGTGERCGCCGRFLGFAIFPLRPAPAVRQTAPLLANSKQIAQLPLKPQQAKGCHGMYTEVTALRVAASLTF